MKRTAYAFVACVLMLASTASAQSAVRIVVDAPTANATVPAAFLVGGWAFDPGVASGAGVDAVHVWAYPGGRGDGVFLGAATIGGERLDVVESYGVHFAGFGLNVLPTLAPGPYVLRVFAHQASNDTWAVTDVPVTIAGVTLSDLECLAQQVPLWTGTSWTCADSQAGVAGPQGPIGPAGPAGATGAAGGPGAIGPVGATGATGAAGPAGPAGTPGTPGVAGGPGPIGPVGATGATGAAGPAGSAGTPGTPGVAGGPGPVGPVGAVGATGAAGPAGSAGTPGAPGPVGAPGPIGPVGATGATGAAGPAGSAGTAGTPGLPGAPGPMGPAGATGPAGAAGGLAEFGHVYNLGLQVVAIEADVVFDSNGVLTPGITHAPGTTQTVVVSSGVYEIGFAVSGVEPNQFAIFVNGALITASIHGSGAGTQQNNGSVLIVLSAGDVVTLRNHSSASAVFLQFLAGGTQANVNASLLIRKLS